MRYLEGVSHYVYIPLDKNRHLYLFGDVHDWKGECPDKEESIHLSEFLYKTCKQHKDKQFTIFLEIYTNIKQKIMQETEKDLNRVYNYLLEHPLSNMNVIPSDIRIKGIHTPLTNMLKAYSFAKFLPESFFVIPKDQMEFHMYRFYEIVKNLKLNFDSLWRTFGFQSRYLYEYFKKEFEKYWFLPKEKERYLQLIESIKMGDRLHAQQVFESRLFKSMRSHFLKLESLYLDLYLCGKILETKPNSYNIVYVGSNHYQQMKRFFDAFEPLDQSICRGEFKCLPLEKIFRNL